VSDPFKSGYGPGNEPVVPPKLCPPKIPRSRDSCDTPLCLTLGHAIFLLVASSLAGGLNAIAGGGSFISFPALLLTGIPAIPANATNTVAMWTGVTASSGAYRNQLNVPRRVLLPLVASSVAGGLIGAILLLKTPAHTFMRLLPWLMLAATLLFTFGKKLTGMKPSGVGHHATTGGIVGATIFELFVAIYGGYFGAGMGFVILAMLALIGMTEIHVMNALKSILSSAINGLAVVAFVIARAIYWRQAGIMIAGAVLGGYFGAHYAQRLPQKWVRASVILVGAGMTVYFFVRNYQSSWLLR
jgi:uncharacterized membrane protein YfcA